MLKLLTLFFALLTMSSLGLAQAARKQEAAKADPRAIELSTGCEFTFTSGNGPTFTQYCLSGNGNIVQFSSPAGFEFLDAGEVYEGYGICDLTAEPTVPYFDYFVQQSDNWGPTAVTTPNATTKKFVRATNDGLWQLTQTITQIKASGSSVGSVKIAMALKNLSAIKRFAAVLRHADVDANGTVDDDNFHATRNFAYGAEPGLSYGLGLTNNTFTPLYSAFTRSDFFGPNPCNFATIEKPFTGDGSIGMIQLLEVAPGSTRTIVMTYKPI